MSSLNDYKKHIQVLKIEQKIGRIQKELETVDYGDECPIHGENDCAEVRKAYDRGYVNGLYEAMTLFELIEADTPQTDCNTNQCVQRVEYVGNDEKSRCWMCKHFERMHETPISSNGSYYTYVVCTAKECNYEPKGELQTDCGWK